MVAPSLLMLGQVPPQAKSVGAWFLMQLAKKMWPLAEKFLHDPTGSVSRLGDVLLWQGESGQHVIGTLEGLSESQSRIEQVVGHIEAAQLAMAGSLGTLTSLSMATLGMTSLAAGFMVWRLNALHARLGAIGEGLSDIQADLKAQNQAHLETSLDFLGRFEHTQAEKDLHTALEEATFATNLYRGLVLRELHGRRRLLALNECGRYYLLALTAQVRCQVLGNQLALVEQRLKSEKPTLTKLVHTTFERVMGETPEVYLDPRLQAANVTLDLITEVFQLAHRLGAVTESEFKDAGQVFEHLRPRIYGAGGYFCMFSISTENLLTNLKYLMACLEEVSRLESFRLRVTEAIQGRLSLQDLEQALSASRNRDVRPTDNADESPVVAFALA